MKKQVYLFLVGLIVLLTACTRDEECRENRYVVMNMKFYAKTLNKTTKVYSIAALPIDSITVRAMRTDGSLLDSVLYKNQKSVSMVSLPLNDFKTESTFVLKFNQKTDTLRIVHTNTAEFRSLECGCLKVHTIDTIMSTSHFVDSLLIANPNVNTTTNAENIRLYHFN